MSNAIVLLSGGMDSLLALATALENHRQIYCLHMQYHQKTASRELKAFNDICDFYQIDIPSRKIIDMSFLSQIGGSSLTDATIEVEKYNDQNTGVPQTYVPFRNTIILSLAVSWAEVIAAKSIYIGANEQDSPGYPDCRQVYFDAFNELIEKGTKEVDIKIELPVIKFKKKQIIDQLVKLKAPIHLSWSCYQSIDVACGECESCSLRLRGFLEYGIKDPISYRQL